MICTVYLPIGLVVSGQVGLDPRQSSLFPAVNKSGMQGYTL